jgi:hypothetical protein
MTDETIPQPAAERRPYRSAWLVLALSVAAGAGLTGCGKEVHGTPEPPTAFGKVRKQILGCPSMQGVYLWPPVDGAFAKGIGTNVKPWKDGTPVPVSRGPMQIWVTDVKRRVTIRSRMINLQRAVRNSLAHEWSYAEYMLGDCSGGTLEFASGAGTQEAADGGGDTVPRGFRLAQMDDGSLAVGIKTVETGRVGHLFQWGDVSAGRYRAPDAVHWQWSKLRRLGDGSTEPPPMDAAELDGSPR